MVGLIESLIRFDIRKVRYQDSITELTKRLLNVAFVTQMTLTLIVTFKVKKEKNIVNQFLATAFVMFSVKKYEMC